MAKLLKLRRGTTSQHGSFTGAEGEVTVDTDKDTLVVHDGSTAGGHELLREDMSNLPAGTIDNADVNASAAIAGTKISPNFGTQNIISGAITTAGALNINSSDPSIYFNDSDANPDFRLRANGGELKFIDTTNNNADRLVINSDGHVDVIGNLDVGAGVDVTGNITCTGTIPAAQLTGTLPALDGSNLTGIAGIPSGVIAMWSGATSAIPTGWVLCDGNNSTPDLRDRFVAGASAGTGDTSWPGINPGATGGATDTTVQVSVNGNTGWASQYANASSMPNASPEPFNSRDRHQHSWGGTFTSGTIPTLPPYYALAFIMKS